MSPVDLSPYRAPKSAAFLADLEPLDVPEVQIRIAEASDQLVPGEDPASSHLERRVAGRR
jgi:hypothetical protein